MHLSASRCNARVISCPQHHCRKCGKAICGKCSSKRSTYPIMGFEFQVRMCDNCYDTIKEEEWVCFILVSSFCPLFACLFDSYPPVFTFACCSRTPLATFHEGKHNIAHMDMDPSRGLMVTCGSDRVVKVIHSCLISFILVFQWLTVIQCVISAVYHIYTNTVYTSF